jgi:phosphoribosylanthranilate isomerase
MTQTRVKICGIKSQKDLVLSVEAGADAVGFVVDAPGSPRNLSINEAKRLIRMTPIFVKTIAVTIPKDLDHLERIYNFLKPDILQIHSSCRIHERIRERLPQARLIGAVSVKSKLTVDVVVEATNMFDAVLLDSYSPNGYGGTGRTHSWELSRHIRDAIYPKPLVLAGGLNPENVGEAIRTVKPYVVDVSSGVEAQPGKKDRGKIIEFIKNAREVEIEWN